MAPRPPMGRYVDHSPPSPHSGGPRLAWQDMGGEGLRRAQRAPARPLGARGWGDGELPPLECQSGCTRTGPPVPYTPPPVSRRVNRGEEPEPRAPTVDRLAVVRQVAAEHRALWAGRSGHPCAKAWSYAVRTVAAELGWVRHYVRRPDNAPGGPRVIYAASEAAALAYADQGMPAPWA